MSCLAEISHFTPSFHSPFVYFPRSLCMFNALCFPDSFTSFSPAFVLSCVFPKQPLYGDVSVSSLHSGGQAFFSCLTGYKLQGSSVLTCRNSSTPYWSGKEPKCLGNVFPDKTLWLATAEDRNYTHNLIDYTGNILVTKVFFFISIS